MKITKVEIFLLKPAAETAPYGGCKPVILKLETDEGIYGLGEAGVSMGIGEHALAGMLQDMAPYYLGQDPMNNEVLWEGMRQNINGHSSGGGAAYYGAMSAFDIAMMDIKGKALRVPIYQLLGGKKRDSMDCYYSMMQAGFGADLTPRGKAEEYAQTALQIKEAGFKAVKFSPLFYDREKRAMGESRSVKPITDDLLELAEERIAAVRTACGEDFGIILEHLCMLDSNGAVAVDEIAKRYHVWFCEEPILPMKRGLYKPLHERTQVPLATGEKIHTRWQFSDLLEAHAVDIIQPDPCNCGGISEAKKICDMAQVYDVAVQMHIAGSPVAVAAAMQLEAAVPNAFIHEYFFLNEDPGCREYCVYDYRPIEGKIIFPDLPGLGQDLSEKAVQEAIGHVVVK